MNDGVLETCAARTGPPEVAGGVGMVALVALHRLAFPGCDPKKEDNEGVVGAARA
jgi:hypothetical protein